MPVTDAQIQAALDRHGSVLDGTWASAARATQRVCWDLREDYALIRKPNGTRCDGPAGQSVDCDKVIHRTLHHVYDVVIRGGSSANAMGWGYEGTFPSHAGDLVEPVPYEGEPVPPPVPTPTPTPTPTPPPCDLAPVLAELAALRQQVEARLDALSLAVQAAAHSAEEALVATRELRVQVMNYQDRLIQHGLQIHTSGWGRQSGTGKLPPYDGWTPARRR